MSALQLNDGTFWEPDQADVLKWVQLYPGIDVHQELNAMCGWLDSNPKKRKTKRGIKRFCTSWLQRAQDKGGSGLTRSNDMTKTRDMTTLDDLTHDFMDSESFRINMLAKHAQYFRDGKRYTE